MSMFAVYADSFSTDDPLQGLKLGERPEPEVPDGWHAVYNGDEEGTLVHVRP